MNPTHPATPDAGPVQAPPPPVPPAPSAKPRPPWPSPVEIRKLPRAQQEAIMEASAELAEEEYRTNKDLTDFEAFAEEP